MGNPVYAFDTDETDGSLVLHFPEEPGSFFSACGLHFTPDHLYDPDPDQAIADFCEVCANAWIEAKTTNVRNWRMP